MSPRPRLDFGGVNAAALAALPAVLARLLPDGRREGSEYLARNPRRSAQPRDSFRIDLDTCRWADLATGDGGTGAIGLAAYLFGFSQAEATRKMARLLGLGPEPVPVIPVPDDAPPMRFRHPEHGEPSGSWAYHDAEGRVVCYVCRFAAARPDGRPGGGFSPVTFCDLGDGERDWCAWDIPTPRPLFDLHKLAARLAAGERPRVLVCEDERAAEAGGRRFPDLFVTTPMGGAHAPHETDWSPLEGLSVTIWPSRHERRGRAMRGGRP